MASHHVHALLEVLPHHNPSHVHLQFMLKWFYLDTCHSVLIYLNFCDFVTYIFHNTLQSWSNVFFLSCATQKTTSCYYCCCYEKWLQSINPVSYTHLSSNLFGHCVHSFSRCDHSTWTCSLLINSSSIDASVLSSVFEIWFINFYLTSPMPVAYTLIYHIST